MLGYLLVDFEGECCVLSNLKSKSNIYQEVFCYDKVSNPWLFQNFKYTIYNILTVNSGWFYEGEITTVITTETKSVIKIWLRILENSYRDKSQLCFLLILATIVASWYLLSNTKTSVLFYKTLGNNSHLMYQTPITWLLHFRGKNQNLFTMRRGDYNFKGFLAN